MQRHQVKPRDDEALLTQAVTFLATKYGRYGYRRITALLKQDGWRLLRDVLGDGGYEISGLKYLEILPTSLASALGGF